MIARMWRGRTRATDAGAYHELLARTGIKDCSATPGNRGVQVFRRVEGDEAEFLFVSLWDSYEAIERFAGPNRETAVYYPEDRKYLLALDPAVVHYEVLA
jgi:heme-degrading monooxygenase HmoA